MAYFDQVIQANPYTSRPASLAYAAQYPIYEQQTPQYPVPNPYTLAQVGYRLNELVYACMQKLMDSVSEAPMRVYLDSGTTPEAQETHPLRELLENPCEGVSEAAFWQITELYKLTAGFAAWEKERNNLGQVIHLWPMRPDWCSFYRGNGRPLDRVRYQPYGLPPVDIPRENVLLFQHFDPLYPLLKGLSPVAVALRTIGVDNAATNYLQAFFQQGAVIAGLLSTDQSLSDLEADRIRSRWRDIHGGTQNWGDIAVLGSGSKYQQLSMNFRDMAFTELDGRDEARICAVLKIPPILVGAKVGLQASTYSNYQQAREAYYDETVSNKWSSYQDDIDSQLLPDFDQSDNYYVEFDTSKVRALKENKDAAWKRADDAAARNLITRDEARQEMGLDPIDNAPVFVGVTIRATDQASIATGGGTSPGGAPAPTPGMPGTPAPAGPQVFGTVAGDVPQDQQQAAADLREEDDANKAAQVLERKRFKAFAATRRREGHPEKARTFQFKHLPPSEIEQLLAAAGAPPPDLAEQIKRAADLLEQETHGQS